MPRSPITSVKALIQATLDPAHFWLLEISWPMRLGYSWSTDGDSVARYQFETVNLNHVGTNAPFSKRVGVVGSLAALHDYIEDFATMRIDVPYIVLTQPFTIEYMAWQEKYNKFESESRQRMKRQLLGMLGHGISGNATGALTTVAEMYGEIARGIGYVMSQSEFMTLEKHWQDDFTQGQIGCCLHCGKSGRPFIKEDPDLLLTRFVIAVARHRRPV